MHIVDTLETARAFHVAVDGLSGRDTRARAPFDAYHAELEPLIEAWTPLTIAINALNRSMGQPDLYPFILPAAALEKIAFVREIVANAASRSRQRRGGGFLGPLWQGRLSRPRLPWTLVMPGQSSIYHPYGW